MQKKTINLFCQRPDFANKKNKVAPNCKSWWKKVHTYILSTALFLQRKVVPEKENAVPVDYTPNQLQEIDIVQRNGTFPWASQDAQEVMMVTESPWWVMIPLEDFADEDEDDENDENDEDEDNEENDEDDEDDEDD